MGFPENGSLLCIEKSMRFTIFVRFHFLVSQKKNFRHCLYSCQSRQFIHLVNFGVDPNKQTKQLNLYFILQTIRLEVLLDIVVVIQMVLNRKKSQK